MNKEIKEKSVEKNIDIIKEKNINKDKKKERKYSSIEVFNIILMNTFRIVLIFMVISAIKIGDKDRILLVVLTSLTSFYREYIKFFTGVKISTGMQIISTTFIIMTALLGTLMGLYEKIIWWDTMLHTMSGVILVFFGLMILIVMKKRNEKLKYSLTLAILFSFFFAMTGGTIWEIMEFLADNLLGMNVQRAKGIDYGVLDTMVDTIANTVGALIACTGIYMYCRKKTEEEISDIFKDWFIVKEEKK